MTRLIEQDIPLEMRYRPTVAYEASELAPNTVYLNANGTMGRGVLPQHLQDMTDPRQLQSFNPDPNAQATAMINAAMAMGGAVKPTIVRKLNGQTTKVIFSNHERTPALPGRRSLAQIRAGRGRNVPLQTASLADLNDAFEEGRAGMTASTAKGLRAVFARHPEAARGVANVARARDVSDAIDPVTGIKMEAVNRMPASVRQRLLDAKTTHHGAKAAIIFHPKKTGYKTPNMPGYRGPTRPDLKPDVRPQAFGALVPGTSQEAFNTATARVRDIYDAPSAKGTGAKKMEELVSKNNLSAASAEAAMTAADEAARLAAQAQAEAEKILNKATSVTVSSDGTLDYQLDDAGTGFQEIPRKCGWKCWLLLALTAAGIGGGAYALLKK